MALVIWLASYPRSGNNFVVNLVAHCFDHVHPMSKYHPEFTSFDALADGRRTVLLKTHEAPENDAPTLFLLRDGRASAVSYFHFLKAFGYSHSLEDVIEGKVMFGGWSGHYRSWAPEERPNTTVIRFEDFTADPEIAIEAVAAMMNVRPVRRFDKTFADLHAQNPKIFRRGSNRANLEELTPDQMQLFMQRHGALLRQLGYV